MVAECSYGMNTERQSIRKLSYVRRGITDASSRYQAALPRPTPGLFKHAFGTSSRKGKEREPAVDDEEDAVIKFMSLLMRKRDLLTKRKDWSVNVEIAKQVSDLEEVHKLWDEWHSVNKVSTRQVEHSYLYS